MDARILVVDDEPEIADLVEVYLKSEGCTVFKCGTGTEALAVVRTQALDLAILDVMLPDISGFTLCGEIRKEHHFLYSCSPPRRRTWTRSPASPSARTTTLPSPSTRWS